MRIIPLALAVVILASCSEAPGPKAQTDPELASLLASPELAPFRLKEKKKGRFSTKYVFTSSDANGRSLHLEVFEGMDADTAHSLREDGIMGVEALYADALSPYPGDISRKIVKDREFKPRLVRTEDFAYYLLYANERFGYGASTGESVKYVSLLGWLHCEDRGRFFKLRLFAPADGSDFEELEQLFLSLGCVDAPEKLGKTAD